MMVVVFVFFRVSMGIKPDVDRRCWYNATSGVGKFSNVFVDYGVE